MASYKTIYDALKSLIPEGVSTSFQYVRQAELGTAPNAPVEPLKNHCGFYITGSRNPVRLASGQIVSRFAGVTLNLYTGQTEADLERGFDWAEEIQSSFDKLINKKYITDTGNAVMFTSSRRLRDVEQFWDKHGTAVFVINYEIQYI